MAHCNKRLLYYTFIHNKDVALKGFLRGCRPTRLNHVTLVFSVFLFYASLSASTLAYTTWYNTSLLIYSMVSEPNFILGIKQISLTNKEDSHVHTSSEVTHAYLLDLDSTASRSRHGSLLCPDPQAQAIRASPYQICTNPSLA